MGDKDIMYELLLDDIDAEMLMNEGDFEIDTGSRDGLQSVKQEDPVLKTRGWWRPVKDQGLQGKSRQTDDCAMSEPLFSYDSERSGHFQLWPCGN